MENNINKSNLDFKEQNNYKNQENYKLLADDTIKLYSYLKEERRGLEKIWHQIGSYVLPHKDGNNFYGNAEVYDSTSILAAEYLASGIWSFVSNASSNWFSILLSKPNLSEKESKWLQDINYNLKRYLGDAKSGFYHKSYEFYSDLVCFGTAILGVFEDESKKNIEYKSIPLSDTYITTTLTECDTVVRKLNLYKNQLKSLNLHEITTSNQSNDTIPIIHIVAPNASKYYNESIKLKGMSYVSYYIDIRNQEILGINGYYEFPYIISRWATQPTKIYGQSPAMLALPDIKMLNAISKTILISAQKRVDPPILAPNEGAVQGIKTHPGGIIYGAVDPISGNPLLQPLNIGGDINNAYEIQEQRRISIKEAFYNSMIVFAYAQNATATEVSSVNEQKLRLIGAKISRIQSEFLYPLLLRQINIMFRFGLLPKPPQEDTHKYLDVAFHGSWNKHQQSLDKIGIQDTSSTIKGLEHFNPNLKDMVNWEKVVRIIARANGVPEEIFNFDNQGSSQY